MQKKNKKIIGFVIVILAVIILLLLLKNILNIQDKNKLALYENTSTMLVGTEPNAPKLSAGMIPIKWNGENFVITTKDDEEWYNTQPAYMMLNDGYYKSELEREIKEEQLANKNVGGIIYNDSDIRGTIFVWIPRHVYSKDTGEIGYIKEETMPGEEWIIPEIFMDKQNNNTKADFSLSGIWLQKDTDTNYATKMSQMNYEENAYGFIANTKANVITSADAITLKPYVDTLGDLFTDISNLNRIILKIIDTNKYEPIKANIAQNTVENRIEIRVTYSSNGISKILDEYGNTMDLTEEDGIILADTGSVGLAKGTYYFTVIDNKGNKKELSITPNVDSLFKVAYTNGTDNMDINATYKKTQATSTAAENTLLTNIKAANPGMSLNKAVSSSGGATAIQQQTRTSSDEKWYFYDKYNANSTYKYSVTEDTNGSSMEINNAKFGGAYWFYSIGTDGITLSGYTGVAGTSTYYTTSYSLGNINGYNGPTTTTSNFYKFVYKSRSGSTYTYTRYTMKVNRETIYSKGDSVSTNIIALDGTYENNKEDSTKKYWYVRNSLAPKYTLYKYDQNFNLKSRYDVDTRTLTTEPIDISDKENKKLKLILSTSGSNYKVYISNDNTNWQEVTEITSGVAKELDVDGWDKLYIKVETNIGVNTNTTRINNIDVAYYKD